MSSTRSAPHNTAATYSSHHLPNRQQSEQHLPKQTIDVDRPLPPPPPQLPQPSSSLPHPYEIPALRQKPLPNTPTSTPVKHGRSVSHPFPSFFGGKRLDQKQLDDDFDSSDGATPNKAGDMRAKSGSLSKTASSGRTDRQPLTGRCMTCDSTVRWPQEIKVFRCTTCLTINDLEPYEEQRTGDGTATQNLARKPMSISVDRTKKLIEHCLNDYLGQMLQEYIRLAKLSQPEVNDDDGDFRASASIQRPTLQVRAASASIPDASHRLNSGDSARPPKTQTDTLLQQDRATNQRPIHSPDESRNPLWTETSSKDPSSTIFRTLESYVAGCLTGCTPLNISFFSVQLSSSDQSRAHIAPNVKRQNSDTATMPLPEAEDCMSELDAKTLLLGDVAENGSWWTGGRTTRLNPMQQTREKSPERWRGIVSAKTPRINWPELAEWYQLLIHAGHDWQQLWDNLQPNTHVVLHDKWQSALHNRMHQDINESQLHLQRCVLKATENLLKRPRRPLKTPEDCRFLLMLLANPLLSSSLQTATGRSLSGAQRQTPSARVDSRGSGSARPAPSQHTLSNARRSGGLGHHSGIVKRILGLIANLPNDVHQFLVSWMSRFSDGHFQRLVDMVSSFVTYRLNRQQDRVVTEPINPTADLVPSFSDSGIRHASELHAALGARSSNSSKKRDGKPKLGIYSEDWQVRAAARTMSLLFQANSGHISRKRDLTITRDQRFQSAGLNAKYQAYSHGQIVPISTFYNTMLDHADLVADFDAWETTKTKFTFCQYPFFLSIWAKIHILEHDIRRQMEIRAREAFFDSILSRKAVSQYLVFRVRRDCLVEDSLRSVSEVVGSGTDDIKKGLRIDFVGEEGIDAGGLRKEWFLSLVREIFDPHHGLFVYDDDSQYCYFNPYCLESSEQFFLVGVLLGLAIHNSIILDVAFPPFVFKKLLAAAPNSGDRSAPMSKVTATYSLEDLAEFRPALANGLRQLLEYDGDVKDTFCRDFVIEVDRYGEVVSVPLCANGHKRAVSNSNRREFVDLYIRYLLDTAVARQFEPFKRGFFKVCGGNALSLFRPEEIELLIRGSDEPLDVSSLRAVATYENWPKSAGLPGTQPQAVWFWECFEQATPTDQRKLLSFITGSDRIPAMGATNLNIKVQLLEDKEAVEFGYESNRFPIARTCFNTLGLYRYQTRTNLETKLWTAVYESEGFGLR